jgi:DnaJ-class molecular chaperone
MPYAPYNGRDSASQVCQQCRGRGYVILSTSPHAEVDACPECSLRATIAWNIELESRTMQRGFDL